MLRQFTLTVRIRQVQFGQQRIQSLRTMLLLRGRVEFRHQNR